MPLIVRYPKDIKAGTVCEKLGSNIDFGPTLLDFAGVTTPKEMQGRSLRPLLQGKTPAAWRTGVFYAYYARSPLHWGIRTERYKLVHFPETEKIEFYDLSNDKYEMTNLSDNPKYAAAIAATEQELQELMEEVRIAPQELPGRWKKPARKRKQPNK